MHISNYFEQVHEGTFFSATGISELEKLIPTLGNRDRILFRDNLQHAQKIWKNDSEKSSVLLNLQKRFHTLLFSIENS